MGKRRTLLNMIFAGLNLFLLVLAGAWVQDTGALTDFTQKNLPPSVVHPFGTDWMGRDMLTRTFAGMTASLFIGLAAAVVGGLIALMLGLLCLSGKRADGVICWLIDLMLGIPHILLLIFVSLAWGKGLVGVMAAISLTHWPGLARVLRGEGLQLREATYVKMAAKLGQSHLQIIRRHYLPHLLPQFFTGMVLTFPHAILHESSLTFLGFGLSPEQPSIGILLAESMKYLAMGKWWLAVFPGICLTVAVLLFHVLGTNLRKMFTPA